MLADSGHNPIIAVGFAYSARWPRSRPSSPRSTSRIVDDAAPRATTSRNLLFAEEQGSFLVGAAAALKSKTGNVGFIGGVQVPLIKKFEAGFTEGAKAVKPDIKVQTVYLTQPPDFTGFNDPAKGRTAAQGMFDGGADVVYHAAGGSGGGLFEAAKAAGTLAIGVDSDQYETRRARGEGRHPHLDAQEGRRRRVRLHLAAPTKGDVKAGPRSSTSSRAASTTPPPAARSTTSRPSSTSTSRRSSTARSGHRPDRVAASDVLLPRSPPSPTPAPGPHRPPRPSRTWPSS